MATLMLWADSKWIHKKKNKKNHPGSIGIARTLGSWILPPYFNIQKPTQKVRQGFINSIKYQA